MREIGGEGTMISWSIILLFSVVYIILMGILTAYLVSLKIKSNKSKTYEEYLERRNNQWKKN